ncbi:MAG: ABC transporter substrate-binding protein [Candidatus Hydrogenedentes bacterium]|nr:ABC transporter substrate-binding protein [Candidatus Hydrogenedentota bacterium]
MRLKTVILVFLLALGLSAAVQFATTGRTDPDTETASTPDTPTYSRIVSMAPSITEDLFALGLGDRVVGVTRYCIYPEEALDKAQVGGFMDANFEAIVATRPDLVVILTAHEEVRTTLATLNIETLTVDHRTVEGILDALTTIGNACGVADTAEDVTRALRDRVEEIRQMTAGLPRPTVLISAGRDMSLGRIQEVYAAGRHEWYDEIIIAAGGENAYPDDGNRFPVLTGEGLLRLQPEVIIEMVSHLGERGYARESIIAQWDRFPDIPAVRNGRVHVLAGNHVTIPGPRFVRVLEDVARVLHPEIDWDTP